MCIDKNILYIYIIYTIGCFFTTQESGPSNLQDAKPVSFRNRPRCAKRRPALLKASKMAITQKSHQLEGYYFLVFQDIFEG